jgi:predicted HD phosphohydrolase
MSESGHPTLRFTTLDALEAHLIGMGRVTCEMEGLSELDHALQCAEVLRVLAPDDLELQIAGLLHDVGAAHGSEHAHGRIGAEALRPLFGERIAELVRLHVDAKRYLVSADPAYRATLSPVSRMTLEQQGGVMSAAEQVTFEASPFHRDAIRLRSADDLAKTPGKPTAGLQSWLPMLKQASLQTR